MNNQDCLSDETVQSYNHGQVAVEDRIKIELHLMKCPGCEAHLRKDIEFNIVAADLKNESPHD